MDPFRTAAMHCPRCNHALSNGEVRHCTACKGTWIPHVTLVEHVGKMQMRVPELEWAVETTRFGLACAVCQQRMEALALFGVAVDRCHAHGVWFDEDELAEVLHRSSQLPRQAEVGGAGPLEGVLYVLGEIFCSIDV